MADRAARIRSVASPSSNRGAPGRPVASSMDSPATPVPMARVTLAATPSASAA